MKKTRVLLSLLMVLLLTVGTPLSALAADHDVTSAEDVLNVVATDTDAEVTMNMKNDIDMGRAPISGNAGQKYTINGNGNTISNVTVDSGDVTINADVEGINEFYDDADVTVNGNVGEVFIFEEAELNVTGDVGFLAAYDSVVEITGDVTGEYKLGDNRLSALQATGNAQVTVNGNVFGRDGKSGASRSVESGGHDAIIADGESVVTVTGNVKGGDAAVPGVEVEYYAHLNGGTGVFATSDATVTVGGNVTGGDGIGAYAHGGNGVNTYFGGSVTVNGDVSGGNVIDNPNITYSSDFIEGSVNPGAGDGIYASSGANINVSGNVTGGSNNVDNGVGGDAVYLDILLGSETEPGSITIGGTISGGAGGANGEDGYEIYYNGYVEGESADTFAKLTVGGFDDDPAFGSWDDTDGTAAANYVSENVTVVPPTPDDNTPAPDDNTPAPAPGDAPLAATPVTGDTFQPALVVGIALLALLGMSAALIIRKKRA